MKIANKISLSLLIPTLVITVILMFILYIASRNNLKKTISEHLITTAKSRANHVETYLEENKQFVELMANGEAFKELLSTSQDSPDYNERFEAVKKELYSSISIDPEFIHINLMNKQGDVVCSTNKEMTGLTSKSAKKIFSEAKKGIYVSDIHFLQDGKKPTMCIAAPIIKNDELLGVITARKDLKKLFEILKNRTGLGETGEIYLVNKDFYMISPSRFKEDVILKQKVETENARHSIEHSHKEHMSMPKQISVFPDYRGKNVLGTHEPILEMRWGLLAEIDQEEAFAPLAGMRFLSAALLIIVSIVVVLLGILISRTISRPIRVLHEGTEIIGNGNFDHKVGTDTRDEIGQLSRAFDKMTENLQKTTTSIDGLNKEIASRKQSEEMLRESEEKYRTILESIEDGYYEVDLAGNFTFFNDSLLKIHGYTRDELMGMNYRAFTEQEKAKDVFEAYNKVYTTGVPLKGYDWEVARKDGTKRDTEVSVSLIKDHEGKPIGFRGIARDITEKKDLHEQLRQAQKMEAIGSLAGGIAHEFNNILGIIIGNNELALMDVPDWSPAKDCLKEIRKASLRAKDVVRNILSFARKNHAQRKPLQISTVIKESLKLLLASIPNLIEIRQNISCEMEMILADPTEVSQVLMNLCTNAVHAIGEEAGVLEVGLEAITLDKNSVAKYEGLNPGHFVKLTVRDTGHGIDPEIIARIFDPYFSTKSLAERTGMGLAIVYDIVKKHDGAIRVESEVWKGTVFEVVFPLLEGEVEQEVKEEPEAVPRGTERILFVDDEESLVKMVKQMLSSLGYQVETRTNSLEALELFKGEPDRFDLVITDVGMPKTAGDRLARELMKIRPDIPVILFTGYSERIDEDRARELGIKAYVLKPILIRDLANTVRRVLGR